MHFILSFFIYLHRLSLFHLGGHRGFGFLFLFRKVLCSQGFDRRVIIVKELRDVKLLALCSQFSEFLLKLFFIIDIKGSFSLSLQPDLVDNQSHDYHHQQAQNNETDVAQYIQGSRALLLVISSINSVKLFLGEYRAVISRLFDHSYVIVATLNSELIEGQSAVFQSMSQHCCFFSEIEIFRLGVVVSGILIIDHGTDSLTSEYVHT